jgi:indole-3-glycerol phosphate synthase
MSSLLDELMAAAERRARHIPRFLHRALGAGDAKGAGDANGTLGVRGRFARAVRGRGRGRLHVIGEFKRASPSAGKLTSRGPLDVAQEYASAGVAALSVVTEPTRFAGSLDDLRRVAARVSLPVLCKDFIASERQIEAAAEAGAAAVLLIVRALDGEKLREFAAAAEELGLDVLAECADAQEVERALALPDALIGVNNRDLATLEVDVARAPRLLKRVPPERIAVAESGYASAADLAPLDGVADAVLVGTALLRGGDVAAFTRRRA